MSENVMTLRLSVRLPPDAKAPGAARHSLDGLAPYLAPPAFETIRLLVSELVTNSYRHARLTDEDWIEFAIFAAGGTARVEVSDPGTGFDGGTRGRRRDDADPASGWGLFMVDRLADRWGVARDGGTRVWFEVDGAFEGKTRDRTGRTSRQRAYSG